MGWVRAAPEILSRLFPPQVLLKLFSYCVKVKVNRQQLVKLEMNTLNVMLGTLNLVSGHVPPAWGRLVLPLLPCSGASGSRSPPRRGPARKERGG